MKLIRRLKLRKGWPQGLASLLIVVAIAAVIIVSTWNQSQTAGRLAIAGVVVFVVALVFGSGRLIGVTTIPVVGASIIATWGGDNPAWVRALVLGILWYSAAELGWDSIERREAARRTAAYRYRRIDETSTVVALTLLVTGLVFLLAGRAPVRTVFVIALVLLTVAAVLVATGRTLHKGGHAPDIGEAAQVD